MSFTTDEILDKSDKSGAKLGLFKEFMFPKGGLKYPQMAQSTYFWPNWLLVPGNFFGWKILVPKKIDLFSDKIKIYQHWTNRIH